MGSAQRLHASSEGRHSRSKHHSSITHPPSFLGENESSWIADDICTKCGALAPNGKLYCSTKCRNDDLSSTIEKGRLPCDSSPVNEGLNQLRYPMTLSPHLTAASSPHASHSHKSATFSRPNSSQVSAGDGQNENSGTPPLQDSSDARSNGSSLSDGNDSDLFAPSPWQTGLDESGDEISDLEDGELGLPPAVSRASHILSRRNSSRNGDRHKVGSLTHTRNPPWSSPALMPSSLNQIRTYSPIHFNRMPGATNLPSSLGPYMSSYVPPKIGPFARGVPVRDENARLDLNFQNTMKSAYTTSSSSYKQSRLSPSSEDPQSNENTVLAEGVTKDPEDKNPQKSSSHFF
ncbi:hypothetical protein ACI68E_003996 [Malassezia pachydermatis]